MRIEATETMNCVSASYVIHMHNLFLVVLVVKVVMVICFCSSRMIEIQKQLSERAVELLALPDDVPSFVLDVG